MYGVICDRRNFIKVKTHQPHQEDFMPYLETLVSENPTWASDTGLDDMKWKNLVYILKAIWRRYKSRKHQNDFHISVGFARRICHFYLNFEK